MEQDIYLNKFLFPTNIMLNVTDDCNLQCRYCFVEQHPHYMTLETAKTAVDWGYQNKIKKNTEEKCSIYFFGGEPMLCYNSIIVPIVDYCNSKYPNIFDFGITTNGTLLNKERIDFFKQNNFKILLSLDGAQETQDFNRPCKNNKQSSFDLVKKNIPYLLENFPNITCRSTIYAPTVNKLFENYLQMEKLGFKYWVGIEDTRHPWSQKELSELEEQINKIYFYKLSQFLNNKFSLKCNKIDEWIKYTYSLFYDSSFFNFENWSAIERCGLGTTTVAIAYDGSIYGCQEQPSKDEKNIFLIGNIFNGGIDREKHKKLLEIYNYDININNITDKCNNCNLIPVCFANVGGCPSTSYDINKTMKYISPVNCQIKKIYLKNSLLILNIFSKLQNERFNSYLFNNIK